MASARLALAQEGLSAMQRAHAGAGKGEEAVRVLICCEFSGTVREEFAARGNDAWSCDLLPTERPGKHIIGDFRSVIQESWDFIGFHYECRVMANSGVRWLKDNPKRWADLDEAAEIFNITLRDPRQGYSENSIMHCHAKQRIDRKQDQVIQPWMFGEPRFKATCLWLRGIRELQPTNRLVLPLKGTEEHKQWSAVHRAPPGPNRWKDRSRTLPGIAQAMADQWSDIGSYRTDLFSVDAPPGPRHSGQAD